MFSITPFGKREFKNVFDLVDNLFDVNYKNNFKLDVKEEDDKFIVFAELPGITKDQVSISYDSDILSISYNVVKEENKEEEGYIHKERIYNEGIRRIKLSNVDSENIKAKLENGILEVSLLKQTPKQKKLIEIE